MAGCYWLLIVNKKDNFINKFQIELITTYYLEFVIKVLRKFCEHSISQILAKQMQISPKAQGKFIIVIFQIFFSKGIF